MESIAHDLLHCKICIQVLYEPFINPCGHTYCYSCLVQWFDNNSEGRRPTCPECRKRIETQPAPNYLVRQMVHKLIQQPQFSDDGESPASHQRTQLEEAAVVERDRASGLGLFKGRFDLLATRSRIPPIHDPEDGVERCPYCAWEIEDDAEVCEHCGISIDEPYTDDGAAHAMLTDDLGFDSAMDEDDEQDVDEVDAEFDLDADLTQQLGIRRGPPGLPESRRGFVPAHSLGPYSVSANVDDRYAEQFDSEMSSDTGMGYAEDEEGDSDEDEDEDEDDTSMEGFIEPDEEDESGSDASSTSSSSPRRGSEAADYEDTNEEGSDDEEPVTPPDTPAPVAATVVRQSSNANKRQRGARPMVIESSDDESEDEGGPVRARRRQWGTAARPVSVDA